MWYQICQTIRTLVTFVKSSTVRISEFLRSSSSSIPGTVIAELLAAFQTLSGTQAGCQVMDCPGAWRITTETPRLIFVNRTHNCTYFSTCTKRVIYFKNYSIFCNSSAKMESVKFGGYPSSVISECMKILEDPAVATAESYYQTRHQPIKTL